MLMTVSPVRTSLAAEVRLASSRREARLVARGEAMGRRVASGGAEGRMQGTASWEGSERAVGDARVLREFEF